MLKYLMSGQVMIAPKLDDLLQLAAIANAIANPPS